MKSDWVECELGEIISLTIDHRGLTPKKLGGDWATNGYRALSAKNVKTGKIVQPESIRFVSEEMYHRWMPDEIEYGDILVTSEAPFGEIYQWNSNEKIVLSQRLFGLRISQKCNSDYVYYYMTTDVFKGEMHARATGTTVIGLRQPELLKCKIRFPNIQAQRQIASVLRVIDNKIVINEKTNQNLADQAQGILYHFMDQYPHQLDPLSDIASVIDCLHSKKPSAVEDSTYQLIQLDNIRDDGFLDMSACKYMISQADYENWTRKCEIVEGDCVITNVGRIGAVSQAPHGTKAAMGRNMTCIRLKTGLQLQAYFITVMLSNHMRRQIQYNTDEGTIMGALNVKNIPKLMFPIFEASVMSELEATLYPLRKQIEYNNLQNQSLAQLRDVLLPRLMSGELDVSEINI